MKPSDVEDAVNDSPAVVVRAPDQIWLCCGDMYDCRGCEVEFDDIKSSFEVSWCEDQIDESDVKYVRADLYEKLEAELQRRAAPASVPAELPESVRRLMEYSGKQRRDVCNPCITANEAIEIANWIQSAAYGREQAQQSKPKQMAWLWYTPNGNGTWMPHVSIQKPIVQSGVHMLQSLYTLPEPPAC